MAKQFIKLGIVYNAFDTNDVQVEKLVYRKGLNLDSYLEGLPDEVDWRVGLNGIPIEPDKYETTEVKKKDFITLVMIPRGGGAKDILRIVALVAVVVVAAVLFAPAIAGVYAGGMIASTGIASIAGMAAVMAVGSYLISALLPPSMPKLDATQGNNYGYDGAKNTAREGVAIPVVYGEFRMAGNYIDIFTETVGDTQYLYGRTVLSDGEIDSVSAIELNEQPIGDFQNITYGNNLGTNSEPINPLFGRAIASVPKSIVLNTSNTNHTTTTAVDAIQWNIAFPSGLCAFSDKGKKLIAQVTLEYGYRLLGSGGAYTTGYYTVTNADTKTLRRTIEVTMPSNAIYETFIRRTTAPSVDTQLIDGVSLGEVGEVQASKVAVRSVATGWYKVLMTDQLSSIPTITWKVKGVKVNQYSNTGTVVTKAWSANPAWIALDMMIGTERGQFGNIDIDWQAFYDWAAHCDANSLYFNGVFDDTKSLWDSLIHVYKTGRAMPVRIGTKVSVAVDKPTSPVMMFGAGNIEKDTFQISYLPLTDRANEFEVSYYDKEDRNKKKSIRIIDPDAEQRGEQPRSAQFELFGVDNFAQAQKEVWFQLYQNRLTRKLVNFRAPVESIALTVGDIALIQHDMVDWGISGRIAAGISTTQVKLDKNITLADGDTLLVVFDQIGAETDVIEERTVTAVDTVNNIVTVSTAFSAIPQADHNYMFGQSANVYRPFRLRSISGNDIYSRQLNFVEYNDYVYSPPEQVIPEPTGKPTNLIVPQVTNLAFSSAKDYNDTLTRDVITTVSWNVGNIRNYAGADVYVGKISTEDYTAGTTVPTYELYTTVNNASQAEIIIDYGYHLFVKVVAFNSSGNRANQTSAPTIYTLVNDPITINPPSVNGDGTAVSHIVESNGIAKISFQFLWSGLSVDVDGFYVNLVYADNDLLTANVKTERFTLQPDQRAIILGNINPTKYYKFSVQSFKRVHDIFNPAGLVISTNTYSLYASENPYRPNDNTPYAGDIYASITTTNPLVDFIDKIAFDPSPSTAEQPISVVLSSESVLIPCDEAGDNPILAGTGTLIYVYEGQSGQLAYDGVGTANGTWTVAISATNVTAGSVTDSGLYATVADLAGMTLGSSITTGSLTYTVTGKSTTGNTFTIVKTQSFRKILGVNSDTVPPATTTGLAFTSTVSTGVTGDTYSRLVATWTANSATDLQHYILSIAPNTGTDGSPDTTWTNAIEYIVSGTRWENDVTPNSKWKARIKAVDKSGNVATAWSTVAAHTATRDATAPSLPTGLTATASFKNIYLSWTNPSNADLAFVEVWSNVTGSSQKLATVNAQPSSTGGFTHSGLTSGQAVTYQLKAIDTSGNETALTSSVSATTTKSASADIESAAINATHIAGSSISTDKLLVAGGNLIANGDLSTGTFANWLPWSNPSAFSIQDISSTGFAKYGIKFIHPGGITNASVWASAKAYTDAENDGIVVQAGRQYQISMRAYRNGSFAGNAFASVYFQGPTGVFGGTSVIEAAAGTISLSATTPTLLTGTFTAPVNATRAWIIFGADAWTAGELVLAQFRAFMRNSGDLIVDGAITTNHMTANTINGNVISAGTLNADKIVAGTITGDKFNTGTSLPGSITVGTTGVNIETTTVNAKSSKGNINLLPTEKFLPGRNLATIASTSLDFYPIEATNDAISNATTGPLGTYEPVWVAVESGDNFESGGWTSEFYNQQGYSPEKSYIYSVWLRRVTTTVGNFFFGCSTAGTQNLNGTTNDNPYFSSATGTDFTIGKWYLAVGILHGASAGTLSNSGLTGIYDPVTGLKAGIVDNALEFKSSSGATHQQHRTFQFYAGNAGDRMDFARPCVEEFNATSSVFNFINSPFNNAAARINANSTNILPGKITVSGATTLADWRKGGDETKIDGGSISANTISANKVTVGLRGLDIEGIEFEANRSTVGGSVVNNSVAWTSGTISYINNSGTRVQQAISASTYAWTTSTVYLAWTEGDSSLGAYVGITNVPTTAIILATYRGGADLIVTYGRTIIDGSKITTGTIDANKITANTILSNTVVIGASGGPTLSELSALNQDGIIKQPIGGSLITGTTYTGSLKVKLPQFFTNTMVKFVIDIYEYEAGFSCTLEVGGYTYSGGNSWINVTAKVIGGNVEYPVYFGHDGAKSCVYVGDAATGWAYPQVVVRDVITGYSNYLRSQWSTGWEITISGAGPQNVTATVLDTLPGADWNKVNGRPSTLSALNSSDGAKLGGIQSGATVGAPTGTNVGYIPAEKVAGWGYSGDTTYINGGSIYTNTLNANSIVTGTIVASKFLNDAGVDIAAVVPDSLNIKKTSLITTEHAVAIGNTTATVGITPVLPCSGHKILLQLEMDARSETSNFYGSGAKIRVYRRVNSGSWVNIPIGTTLSGNTASISGGISSTSYSNDQKLTLSSNTIGPSSGFSYVYEDFSPPSGNVEYGVTIECINVSDDPGGSLSSDIRIRNIEWKIEMLFYK